MPTARGGLGLAVVNGKIFAIGGDAEKVSRGQHVSGGIVGTNEEYDPVTDTWTTKSPMPTPRTFFAITVYQNKIFCIGGSANNGRDNPPTGVNEVYNPATDSWETKAAMPTPRDALQANVLNGKIYCIGGTAINGATGVNEVYDPTSDTWTTKSPMPTVTDIYSPSAVFDDKIFIFCGFSYYTNEPVNFQKTQIYDPVTDNWSSGAPSPNGVYGQAVVATGQMATERIYVLSNGGNQIYDPENNTWTLGANIPTNGQDFGAAVVNDKLYVIGGRIWTYPLGSILDTIFDLAPSAANDEYTPAGYGTPDPTYLLEHTLPKISIESPLNQTYKNSSVPIVFTVDKNITSASYSLDSQQNITIVGNTTIANIPNGFHNLTIFANDTYGNVGSETANFTVEKPQTGIFGSIIIIAVIAVSVAIVCLIVGLLAYRRHRKTANLRYRGTAL
ncbi:MAG: hypothetical protein ABSF44_03800 [Candidatus Bathyarchaeia archaeon]